MIHLAINATEIGRQRGGNESHLLGLLEGLKEQEEGLRLSLLVTDVGAQHPLVAGGPWQALSVGRYRRLSFHLWEQTRLLQRLHPDWYLSTYFLPPVLPCRGAVIVHDLSFLAHPDYYPRSIATYMRYLTGRAAQQAERVLVVSEFTRAEVRRFYPQAAPKTAVIWNGVSDSFSAEAPEAQDMAALAEYGIARPYILAIGNIHPRKNLARLLEAYEQLTQQGVSLPRMVWVGMPRWGSEALIARATAAGVLLTGYVPQAHLPALYRQARMFVYPSLYEGFGLPVVEAMACGTPLVCANASSLPEVAGDAALLVDPEDVGAIAHGVRQLVEDDALAKRLRARGLERAKRFTWKETARLLMAALR